jgi:hypothetical protein
MEGKTWWWTDPEWAWFAKTARAKHHIDDLECEIRDFLSRGTFNVASETGQGPGEIVYRLQMSEPIPIGFSTTIGDALHNLRSALDCAAFEMACRHVRRNLTEPDERACAFPIYGTRDGLDRFFSDKSRAHLFGTSQQEAIRAVQPGHLYDSVAEEARKRLDRDREVAFDHLYLLNRLSNIDKHRRLHVTVWWPGLVYWGSDGSSKRKWIWGIPPFEDGSILGRLLDDPDNPEPPPPEIHHDIELRLLAPEGAANTDARKLLHSIYNRVVQFALPRTLGASVEG